MYNDLIAALHISLFEERPLNSKIKDFTPNKMGDVLLDTTTLQSKIADLSDEEIRTIDRNTYYSLKHHLKLRLDLYEAGYIFFDLNQVKARESNPDNLVDN